MTGHRAFCALRGSAAPSRRRTAPARRRLVRRRWFTSRPFRSGSCRTACRSGSSSCTRCPVAQVNLVVLRGSADDPAGKFGIATLTAAMLQEGAGSRTSLELADAIDFLGADLTTTAGIDSSAVRLHVPVARLADALPLMADVALRPTFPKEELDRLRQERLTAILQARDNPATIDATAFNRVLYGATHRYGTSVNGTAATLKSFSVDDLRAFYAAAFQPGNSSLLVIGDVTMDKALPMLESSFGGWKAQGGRGARRRRCPPCRKSPTRTIYLVDKPGAPQSQIRIGWVGVPRSTPDYFPIQVMNTILGGSFASRLNMNLREKNGYTYGASSGFDMRASAGPFVATAGVQTDKTSEALKEFFNELNGIVKPVPAEELSRAEELRVAAVSVRVRDDRRHLAQARGRDRLPPARRLLREVRAEYRSGHRGGRAARGAEVRPPGSQRRRDHGRSEGHRARNCRAEARRDQDSDDRRGVRPAAGALERREAQEGRLAGGKDLPHLPPTPRAPAAGEADPPPPDAAPRASPAPCRLRRTPGTSAGT